MIDLHGELYATAAEAAEVLGDVTPAMIRDWRRRGLIEWSTRLDGRYWYRMADVWDAERDTRARGRRRSVA